MKKLLILMLFAGVAHAETGPIKLDMLKPKAGVNAEAVAAMVAGFEACSSKDALPRDVLAPLGVQYLSDAALPAFAYADLLRDRSVLVLRGNDPASMEKVGDGRFMTYGGHYKLKKVFPLTGDVQLTAVSTLASVGPVRAIVGVTYFFNKPLSTALGSIDAAYGTHLKSKIGMALPSNIGTVKAGEVWFVGDASSNNVICWRAPEAPAK